MAKNMAIQELPDFPAIKQIQGALWRIAETHGADVFVGAGFSRIAVLPRLIRRSMAKSFYAFSQTALRKSGPFGAVEIEAAVPVVSTP